MYNNQKRTGDKSRIRVGAATVGEMNYKVAHTVNGTAVYPNESEADLTSADL